MPTIRRWAQQSTHASTQPRTHFGPSRAVAREFDMVTVQRELKDAGRFVFIERKNGNPSFLKFVQPTIEKARASLARLADYPELAEIESS